MRRLRRILINSATALSVMLCVGTAALWNMSYPFGDEPCSVTAPTWWLGVSSFHGDIGISIYNEFPEPPDPKPGIGALWDNLDEESTSVARTGHVLIFGFADEVIRHRSGSPVCRRRAIFVPHLLLVVLSAVMPIRFVSRRMRRMNAPDQRICSVCGYDLRATPDRCPECGTIRS